MELFTLRASRRGHTQPIRRGVAGKLREARKAALESSWSPPLESSWRRLGGSKASSGELLEASWKLLGESGSENNQKWMLTPLRMDTLAVRRLPNLDYVHGGPEGRQREFKAALTGGRWIAKPFVGH